MLEINDLTELNLYLIDNLKKNQKIDRSAITKLQNKAASFDPLQDQSDNDGITVTPKRKRGRPAKVEQS